MRWCVYLTIMPDVGVEFEAPDYKTAQGEAGRHLLERGWEPMRHMFEVRQVDDLNGPDLPAVDDPDDAPW